jgi:hypothetical protein
MNTATEAVSHEGHGRKFHETITYNGISKTLEAEAQETVKVLLDRAIRAFGITQNTHLLALFTQDGRELQNDKTLREEGAKPNDHLLLRPSVVRGG